MRHEYNRIADGAREGAVGVGTLMTSMSAPGRISAILLLAAAVSPVVFVAAWIFRSSERIEEKDALPSALPPVLAVGGDPARPSLVARVAVLTRAIAGHADQDRQRLIAGFGRGLDLAEVRLWLAQFSSPGAADYDGEIYRSLFMRLAQLDPKSAANIAKHLEHPELRQELQQIAVELWSQVDAAAAARWVLSLNDSAVQAECALTLVRRLKNVAPRAAADFLSTLPAERARDAWLDQVVMSWAEVDFAGALEWVRQSPNSPDKERALIHLSYRWLGSNPQQAMEYARSQPASNGQLLNTMANQWAMRDPQAASEWASRLPEMENRSRVLASVAATWAQCSPMDALRFVSRLPADQARDDAVISAVSGWARRDSRAAVEWVSQLSAGPLREEAYTQVIFAWVQCDVAAAAGWLATLPDGYGRDSAFSTFSGSLAEKYPALALTFAENIDDEAMRTSRIDNVACRWLVADPDSASVVAQLLVGLTPASNVR